MHKHIITTAVAVMAFAVTACQQEPPMPPSPNNPSSNVSLLVGDPAYTRTDVANYFNVPNVTGVIWLTRSERNELTTNAGTTAPTVYDATEEDGRAVFMLPGTTTPLSIDQIYINGAVLNELVVDEDAAFAGNYIYRATGTPLGLHFGTGADSIGIDDTAHLPVVDAGVSFASPIHITGIIRGQNVSRSSSLTLTWAIPAGATSRVEVEISKIDWNATPSASGHIFVTDDDGSFTIPASSLQQLTDGNADISLRRIESKTIALNNGQNIQVFGTTKHTVTVQLTP